MTDTFMGIELESDGINKGYRNSVEQWSMSVFEELVRPILEVGISIRWDQYTPYFNDGESCEFSTGEVRFRPADGDEEAGDYEDGFLDLYDVPLKGGEQTRYERREVGTYTDYYGRRTAKYETEWVPTGVTFPQHHMYEHMSELARSFGHFEELLYDTFGDHAQITMTHEKVIKEWYDHE